ncbi:dna ligase 4 [Nannochloropsis oceanica]
MPPPPVRDVDYDDSSSPLKQAVMQQQEQQQGHDGHTLPCDTFTIGRDTLLRQQDKRHQVPGEILVKLEAAANALPFALFCDKLEMLERKKASGHSKRRWFFDSQLCNWLKKASDGPVSLYPIIKFLLPEKDARQGQYKLGPKTIGEALVKALGLSAHSDAAQRITNLAGDDFKRSAYVKQDYSGDFATKVESVLTTRIQTEPSKLTLKEIDSVLEEIAHPKSNEDGKAKMVERLKIFSGLTGRMNPRELKWLVRLLLGDMKTGMKSDTVLKVFGEDGPSRLETVHDLRTLCAEAALNVDSDVRVQLMTPFKVHVCARANSASAALSKMEGQPFLMERKLDGERYVLHKRGNQLRFFSRNLKDARPEYYTILNEMFLARLQSVEDLILDGEVVAWSDKLGDYERFGSNKTVAIAQAQEAAAGIGVREEGQGAVEGRNLMYVVFDVVYVGGRGSEEAFRKAGVRACRAWEVGKKPLRERRALLSAIANTEKKVLEIVEHREVGGSSSSRPGLRGGGGGGGEGRGGSVEQERLETLSTYFDHAVENGWEGLVIKKLDSTYMGLGGLGGEKVVSREKGGWVKMKPDYAETTEEMDVVMLGGYYRGGALWSGYPSRFLFGVRATNGRVGDEDEDEDEDEGEREVMYHTFARVANGLKTRQREELQEQLKGHWMEGGVGKKPPPWVVPSKPAKDYVPPVWLDIKNAPVKVVSVKGGELVKSRYSTVGLTVRFPRITRLRPEKGLEGVMTEKELKAMMERPPGMHFARPRQVAPWVEGAAEKGGGRRGRRKVGSMPLLTPGWAAGVVGGVEVKGKVFVGLNVCLYGSTFVTTFPGARGLMGMKEGRETAGGRVEFMLADVMRVVKEQGGEASTNLVEESKTMRQMYEEEEEEGEEEESGGQEANGKGKGEVEGREEEGIGGRKTKRKQQEKGRKSTAKKREKKRQKKKEPCKSYEQDFLIVPSGQPCLRTTAAKLTRGIDILSFEWLLECLQAGRRIAPRFEHYIGMTRETEERMHQVVDIFGDPWTDTNGTVKELMKVLQRMPALPFALPTSCAASRGIAPEAAWQRLVEDGGWSAKDESMVLTAVNLFWGRKKVFYLDRYSDCGPLDGEGRGEEGRKPLPFTTLDAAMLLLRLHGAVVSSSLHAGVSHIVVDRRERSRFSLLLERKRALRRHPWNACEKRVVGLGWVEGSVAAGYMMGFEEEGEYEGAGEGEGRKFLVSDKELAGGGVGLGNEEKEEDCREEVEF